MYRPDFFVHFRIICPCDGCPVTQTTVAGIKSHVYSKHRHEMSEELEASVPEGVTDAIEGVSDDGSTAASDQGTKVEDLIDNNHRISAKDRVMTELSDDFFSFYGYVLDALCIQVVYLRFVDVSIG